jgi:hypothetical protein
MTVVEFERVWWDYNSGANSRLSVWRPVCPPGWASLGDVAVARLEPPVSTVVVRVGHGDRGRGRSGDATAPPLRFEQVRKLKLLNPYALVFFITDASSLILYRKP